MSNLENKVVLVTAAGQGIGRASAQAFARAGARVWAIDRDEGKLAGLGEAAGGGALRLCRLDVLDEGAIERLVTEIGRIDVLFNCTGVVQNGTVLECGDADLDLAFDLNVKAMARSIRAVLPGMLERGDGSIINMASVASSVKAVPNRFAYSVTKAAVIGLTKSVAADYVARGIRCNAICPGTVENASRQDRPGGQGEYKAPRAAFVARQPIGTPEDIADLVLYLAGAAYTTGQIHVIDGGWAA
ncbi:SDR family oxidoreductase [Azospirillum sp. YIM B02556]|uniref:SDR family oxidoreductase n=1 Tax=Azospirillum endophyticum TaxID=2800326 RepID=A0ABS1F4T3_9PROT|nr:SDR family oxidoreductase [Azospirillum endophyticum]MBK1838413.1 SDR family oxidoreductase [Azospirillum endophyticum]